MRLGLNFQFCKVIHIMELHSRYAQWNDPLNRSGRDWFRRIALDALSICLGTSGFPDAPRVQFVYFHHVFEDEEENLRQFLKYYSQHYTFISYSDGVSRVSNHIIYGV